MSPRDRSRSSISFFDQRSAEQLPNCLHLLSLKGISTVVLNHRLEEPRALLQQTAVTKHPSLPSEVVNLAGCRGLGRHVLSLVQL